MIYKRCPICGKRIPEGTQCICRRQQHNRSNRTDGIRKQYKTYRWQKLREAVLARYDFIDLYALYHDGKVVPADCVHHITEILDDPGGFYDVANLFPTSAGSHASIHDRYKREDPKEVRRELREYMNKWNTSTS